MNWSKAIGYGLGIWMILYAASSLFVASGMFIAPYSEIVLAIMAGILAIIFADYAGSPRGWAAVVYGAVWAGISFLLDYFVTAYFAPRIFASWSLWAGYGLILLAPLIYGGVGSPRVAHAKW